MRVATPARTPYPPPAQVGGPPVAGLVVFALLARRPGVF